jgi:hypothetical protein
VYHFSPPYSLPRQREYGIGDRLERNCPLSSQTRVTKFRARTTISSPFYAASDKIAFSYAWDGLSLPGKFDYYDAVAHVIPGTIGCLFLFFTLDLLGIVLPRLDVGGLGLAGIGFAVAYTLGHLLQSISSSLEPLYYACWGGLPSANLLERESRHFSNEQRQTLIQELVVFFKVKEKCPANRQGIRSFHQRLFERSMTLCNKNKLGRVEAFVAIYGFHRVLLTTFLLGFVACATIWLMQFRGWLSVAPVKMPLLKSMVMLTGIGFAIEIFRARKRAYHYAREVLWMTSEYIRASGSTPGEDSALGS